MSYEIAAGAPSAFQFDPQVGASETISGGDTLIVQGGNAAIQTSNGGVDTLNISLILDPEAQNLLVINPSLGLDLNLCRVGGFLDASNGSVGITDTIDIGWLAGKDASGCLAPVNLTHQLIPFGNNGAWAADSKFKYDQAADRLFADIFRTTNPPNSPTLPILAYVEDATGDIGKLALSPGSLLIGGLSGEITEYLPGDCTGLPKAVNGLGVDPATGEWANIKFRERYTFRTVSVSTTLTPGTDDVLLVDNSGGARTITLTAPANCEPTVFHVKQIAANTTNAITLTPATGTIEGAGSHVFGNTNSAQRESRMIAFDGTNWHVV